MTIGIIDLGIGNISSVRRMIEKVGAPCEVLDNPKTQNEYDKFILPGVGNFGEGAKRLNDIGFKPFLQKQILRLDKPILGICLGMHLLCRKSEESDQKGLEFIPSDVVKFKKTSEHQIKIPNMGWSKISIKNKNPLITKDQEKFYFVHSYFVKLEIPELEIASCEHGERFCAAFQKNNIFGVQFHPEKSHQFGLSLMKNFVDL